MKNPKSKTPTVEPCETDPKQAWRPPPWAWLGDDCCAYMSITILALISPLMAVLIGSSEVTWAIWLKIKKHVDFSPVASVVRTISEWVGKRILKDPRNSPYLPVLLWLGVYPSLLFAWAVYRYSRNGLEIWFVFLYHFLRIGPRFRCFAYFHVLAHKEGHDHKGFFLPPFQSLNFTYVQWFVALFYGAIPNSYAVGHNKIHHRYSNGLDDVHTCYDLDRTDPWSFLLYLPRFAAYWTGFSVFWHFMSRKEYRFAGRMLAGMVYFYGIIILVGKFFGWDFAFAFLLFPVCEAVVFFGAISYLWHSFLDGDNLDCEYVNSVTIIEGLDNIYNEDFHVVHHLPGSDQNIHWTEYPGHYEKNIEEYKKYQATVFRDCEEGMMLYWMFSKQWDVLADHYVDLNGKMNHEEKKAHVLKRLSTIMPPPAQELKCKSQ